jgi:hypothetical protein
MGHFGILSGKAAVIELETLSYNDDSGVLLCMNRFGLPSSKLNVLKC